MATRAGIFLLGCITGGVSYYCTNRDLQARTASIERYIAGIGYRVYALRAATGMPESAGGVVLPKQAVQPLHPKPVVPPEQDAYWVALESTLIHKWNSAVRTVHKSLLDILAQQTDANASRTQQQPKQ